MSNNDSFIDEVTEEVRRDKLFNYMRRYGWIAVVLVLLLVGGAAWTEWQRASERERAQDFGDAVLNAVDTEDPGARRTALAAIAADGPRGVVLGLLAASEDVRAEDRPAALAEFDRIAADASLPQSYRDLALLKQVMLAGPEMPAVERTEALAALATPGRPFRTLALEQQALMQLEVGETEAAIASLQALMQEPQLTAGLRRRVSQLMVALGVDPAAE